MVMAGSMTVMADSLELNLWLLGNSFE